MSYLVAAVIAGEVILFGILQVANRSGARTRPYGLGWFYFALCLGMFAMGATSFFAYVDTFKELRELDRVGLRYVAVTQLLDTLKDMETGHRGFLLTGRGSYLAPYRKGETVLPARCNQLRAAYKDSGDDVRVEQVVKLAEAKAREMRRTIELRENRRPDEALEQFNSDVGKNTMDLVRIAAGELGRRDLGRYNAIKAELIRIAESRIAMAVLVTLGAIVQMWLGAFGGWRAAHPEAGAATG